MKKILELYKVYKIQYVLLAVPFLLEALISIFKPQVLMSKKQKAAVTQRGTEQPYLFYKRILLFCQGIALLTHAYIPLPGNLKNWIWTILYLLIITGFIICNKRSLGACWV